ncbi:HIT domain-containing protein [Egibacter rhizosphaerae]|uniref:HIT domain-containing protein n=1 Tax=Egibacter rhizosphaerae TaxID=1670831 RepID=A0A411YJT2_9ACTN|nr:HIT domain-containing protein [Egibacter rhizosphaerae]QBI21452.1 HIT domain-containing protein [Egibacter rhizosphaerae]
MSSNAATPDEGPVAGGGAGGRLDDLQRLWTPWRMAYVADPDRESTGCPFCELPGWGPDRDADALILHRGERVFTILNAFPYNPGHLMIVPYRHVPDLADLDEGELAELGRETQRAVGALRAASGPHGFNLGMNLGGIAGAGIAEHVHQHVVPRWGGDTNFMPVIGQTKVLPQMLEETYERLAPQF